MSTTYPWGYGRATRTLSYIRVVLTDHYHPEYIERLCAWLEAQGGHIGIGGHWRATGTQPDRPGFAPEGKSFHQDQAYNDGFFGACAVDLVARNGGGVHRAPHWSEVPVQGSVSAETWGVHCNISTESWHMQPVEIDGWQTWKNAGSPAPVAGHPFPGRDTPPPQPPVTPPTPPQTGTDMGINALRLVITDNTGQEYHDQIIGLTIANPEQRDHLNADSVPLMEAKLNASRVEIEARLGFELTPKT